MNALVELTNYAGQVEKYSRRLHNEGDRSEVRNALECLKSLGIRQGDPSGKFWKFTLELKSEDTTDNLNWLFNPGGEWDRRYQEWKKLYRNRDASEKPGTPQSELSPASSPYRGLFAFTEEDKQYFFGRENFTEKLVKAVQSKPAIAVTGSSGSGKSSVVFAGLIPELKREPTWLIDSFRPKSQPSEGVTSKLKG